jgi:hypothetical protein
MTDFGGKHDGGTLLPKPPDSPAIWDPRDPFIIALRAANPHTPPAWRRTHPGV